MGKLKPLDAKLPRQSLELVLQTGDRLSDDLMRQGDGRHNGCPRISSKAFFLALHEPFLSESTVLSTKMPPKKSATTKSHPAGSSDPSANSKAPKQEAEAPAPEPKDAPAGANASKHEKAEAKAPSVKVPSKRKAKTSDEPSKAPRRSARGTQQAPTDPAQMLRFLLSPASLDLCRPKDEIEDLKARGPDIRTYSSSDFSPFEELVCAVILSRPISHALGLRSIRTIFNEPYEFTTPKKIREVGMEGCRKALDHARTQHRQKTAEELVMLADAVVETLGGEEDDVSLERVRKESDHNVEKVRLALTNSRVGFR